MDELITIPHDRVQRWWSLVREGLDEIARRTHPDWIPEDIYASLRSGESRLVCAFHDDIFCGFAVVLDRTNPFNGSRALIAWAVWIKRNVLFDPFIAKFQAAALRDGYDKVLFQSPREGWMRRLYKYGFKPAEVIYECELRPDNGGRTVRPESTHKH